MGLSLFFSSHAFATDETRRAPPAPFDDIFPSAEHLGPTIGVPNTDPIGPLNHLIWKNSPALEANDIRIYGWVNPSYNASTSKASNIPLSFVIVPNHVELEQVVLRVERVPNTVQTDHGDWGFRVTNLYGIDYRYTISEGIFSQQLYGNNQLYGEDPFEVYGQIYFPAVAEGMLVTIGRYSAPADIESQLAPYNYLVTHSLIFGYDASTQTGINTTIKLNDSWTLLLGLVSVNDVAPWMPAATPTFEAMVRWVSRDNNDSLWGGITSLNNGKFRANRDNLQEFNLTWTHRFTEKFFSSTEVTYLYQYDAAKGGSCNFAPVRSFGGGGGCGPIIPGLSSALGIVNYIEFKVLENNFMSFRTDFFDDYNGQRTGYATPYMGWTLGITHNFSKALEVRPEIRYETAFKATPYDNGTRKDQTVFVIDMLLKF